MGRLLLLGHGITWFELDWYGLQVYGLGFFEFWLHEIREAALLDAVHTTKLTLCYTSHIYPLYADGLSTKAGTKNIYTTC
jgi:hypothetical protein